MFENSVAKIPYIGSTTRIDKALMLASEDLFKNGNGVREFVPKILLLITGKIGYADFMVCILLTET